MLSDLFNAGTLLLVCIVCQFEVLGHVVIPGRLLDLDLLRELEDLLLQLGDGLLGALGVWGAVVSPGEGAVSPTRQGQRGLSQPTHLQPVDLERDR